MIVDANRSKARLVASGRRAGLGVAGVAALVALCSLLMFGAGSALAQSCSNAQYRSGPSASLPDCRAYELVSPPETDGFDVAFGTKGSSSAPLFPAPAAPSGDLVSFYSFGAFAGNPASAYLNQYLSMRTASGWSTQGISPAKEAPFYGIDVHTAYTGFSGDLSETTAVNWIAPGLYALLLRNEGGAFEQIAEGTPLQPPVFAGASADFSHVLVLNQTGGDHLYEWSEKKLSPISGTDGTPSLGEAGAFTGPFGASWGRAISADGSRVYWTGGGTTYLYEKEAQRNIAASQCTTGRTGEAGGGGNCTAPGSGVGSFETSSLNGEEALFISKQELTDTANTGAEDEGSDLYSFNAATGSLRDLTLDPAAAKGAEVLGAIGASEDGSYVYFVANGVLASGATQGACASFAPKTAKCNLYLEHEGKTSFVATVSQADNSEWVSREAALEHSVLTQTTAGGRHLLFTSTASPTGYDSEGHSEIYLYDASTGELSCVSCSPTGAAAAGDASLGSVANGPQDGGTSYENIALHGGRIFFQSNDALLPGDSNGLENVYEWEANRVGGCESEADNGGCLYSISTGTSSAPDFFQNTTPSGQDVFFTSEQQLVGQDVDGLNALYDARAGGGFPAPALPAQPCSETLACRASSLSVAFAAPGSELVSGAGNIAPAALATGKHAKPRNKRLTRRQKLKRALRRCARVKRGRRRACRASARRRFGRAVHRRRHRKAHARRVRARAHAHTKSTRKGRGSR